MKLKKRAASSSQEDLFQHHLSAMSHKQFRSFQAHVQNYQCPPKGEDIELEGSSDRLMTKMFSGFLEKRMRTQPLDKATMTIFNDMRDDLELYVKERQASSPADNPAKMQKAYEGAVRALDPRTKSSLIVPIGYQGHSSKMLVEVTKEGDYLVFICDTGPHLEDESLHPKTEKEGVHYRAFSPIKIEKGKKEELAKIVGEFVKNKIVFTKSDYNAAIQRLMASGKLDASLSVSEGDDKYDGISREDVSKMMRKGKLSLSTHFSEPKTVRLPYVPIQTKGYCSEASLIAVMTYRFRNVVSTPDGAKSKMSESVIVPLLAELAKEALRRSMESTPSSHTISQNRDLVKEQKRQQDRQARYEESPKIKPEQTSRSVAETCHPALRKTVQWGDLRHDARKIEPDSDA